MHSIVDIEYAVSSSGDVDTGGQGSVLLRDIADVKRLRDDGPNRVTQGSTELVHAPLANDLVDAMTIFVRSCSAAAKGCLPRARRRTLTSSHDRVAS
jgi:hypothetical protein